ncbi:hypothetical protein GY45DRAFT_595213 [Cubamyces sp. BRFM 1775]|nr:hypothetical protein GY45DRAFT_595213 [Cubamyces sp. BRFM 1775]
MNITQSPIVAGASSESTDHDMVFALLGYAARHRPSIVCRTGRTYSGRKGSCGVILRTSQIACETVQPIAGIVHENVSCQPRAGRISDPNATREGNVLASQLKGLAERQQRLGHGLRLTYTTGYGDTAPTARVFTGVLIYGLVACSAFVVSV